MVKCEWFYAALINLAFRDDSISKLFQAMPTVKRPIRASRNSRISEHDSNLGWADVLFRHEAKEIGDVYSQATRIRDFMF